MDIVDDNMVWEDLLSLLPAEIAVSCLRPLPMRVIGRLNVSSKKSYEGGVAWQLTERIVLTRDTCHRSPQQLYSILSSQELVNARYLEIDTSTPPTALEAILPQLSSSSLNVTTVLLIDTEPMSASSWYQSNMFQASCLPSIAPRLRSWWLRVEHDGLLRNAELDLSTQGIVESRLETCLQGFTEKLENLEELRLPALFTRHLMPKPTKRNSIASFVPKLPSLRRLITMGRPPVEVVHRGETDSDGVEHIFFCGDGLFESESAGDHRIALNSYWDFPAIIDGSLHSCPRPCTLLHMFVGLSRCLPKNLHSFLDNSGAPFEVNERLDHGPIALHVAIKRKHKDAVCILLEAGSDITLRDLSSTSSAYRNTGHNALTLAVHCSTQPIVEALFTYAELNSLFDPTYCEEGLGRGTPLLLRDAKGATVLTLAAARTDADGSDVLKWLLDPIQMQRFNLHVDDSSADKWLAPIHCVRTSEASRALAAAGSNLMARTIDGDTPITHLIQTNFNGLTMEDTPYGIAQTLRQLGACLPQSGSYEMFRALNGACNIPSTSWLEMLLSVAEPVADLSRVEITPPIHPGVPSITVSTLLYRCIKNAYHNHLVLLLAAGADASQRINDLTYIEACLMQPSIGIPTRLMKMIVLFASHGCPLDVHDVLPSPTKTPKLSVLAADFLSKADASIIAEETSCLQAFISLIIPSEGPAGTFELAMSIINRMKSPHAWDLIGELVFNSAPGFWGVATLLGGAISRGNIQIFEWLLKNKPREENFTSFGPDPFLSVLNADDDVSDEQRHFMARCLADAGCKFDSAIIMAEVVPEKANQYPLTVDLFTQLSHTYASPPATTSLGCFQLGGIDDTSRDEETSIVISTDEAPESARFGQSPLGQPNGPRRSARLEAKSTSKQPVAVQQDASSPPAKRSKRS